MLEFTIAIAGHVDHGKSSLVKALTGVDPDILKEEKERGLTIEPSVVPFKLSSEVQLAFVDLPGHEDFIKNMVRGATCVDAAILVVAANDGVMPQTKEHLEILKLLNIQHGLIVLSKIDLVDEETQLLAQEEVKELVKGSFLSQAPIIPFSAQTQEGISLLLVALSKMVEEMPCRRNNAFFRMPIDRVLHVPGQGLVITGTVLSGKCRIGQVKTLYPLCQMVKVKRLQVHRQDVDEVTAGRRVGINLGGLKEEIKRGMVLADNGLLEPSRFVNALLQYTHEGVFNNYTTVKLFLGTMEVTAKVVLLDKERLMPGETGFVQFRCTSPVTALPGDRFVIRSLSPAHTIGGGIVVEVTRRKFRQKMKFLLSRYQAFCQGVNEGFVFSLIQDHYEGLLSRHDLFKQTGSDKIIELLDQLKQKGKILEIEGSFYAHSNLNQIKRQILSYLKEFHQKFYFKWGVGKDEICHRFKDLNLKIIEYALKELCKENLVALTKGRYHLKDFTPRLNREEQELSNQIKSYAIEAGLKGFTMALLKKKFNIANPKCLERALEFLIENGYIVVLNSRRLIYCKSLNKAWKKIKGFLMIKERLSLEEAKELLGLSRQYTVPILDYLDTHFLTLRIKVQGKDYRILSTKKTQIN